MDFHRRNTRFLRLQNRDVGFAATDSLLVFPDISRWLRAHRYLQLFLRVANCALEENIPLLLHFRASE